MTLIYRFTIGSDDGDFTTIDDLRSQSDSIGTLRPHQSLAAYLAEHYEPFQFTMYGLNEEFPLPDNILAYVTADEYLYWIEVK